MDILERLRSDMDDAGCEAYVQHEDEVEACLAVLDEFIAGHEVVEVERLTGEDRAVYYPQGFFPPRSSGFEVLTIIVPRAEPPSLLAAAEVFLKCCENVRAYTGEIGKHREAEDALAAEIKKEREKCRR